MKSFDEWKKVNEEMEPKEDIESSWQYLKQTFGGSRLPVDMNLQSKLNPVLDRLADPQMVQENGGPDGYAQKVIVIILNKLFGDASGAGNSVQPNQLAANTSTPGLGAVDGSEQQSALECAISVFK